MTAGSSPENPGTASPARPYQAVILCLLGAAWLFCVIYVPFFNYRDFLGRWSAGEEQRARLGMDIDFQGYILPAHMIRDGNANIYDTRHSAKYLGAVGIIRAWKNFINSPPTFYLMMFPFSYPERHLAGDAWLILKYLCILWSSILLARLVQGAGNPARPAPALVLFILLALYAFAPSITDMWAGNVNLNILFLMCCVLVLMEKGMKAPAGALLGFVFCLKLTPALLLFYFALRRDWKVIVPAVASIGVMILATAILFGPGVIIDYLAFLPGMQDRFRTVADVSISSRLFLALGANSTAAGTVNLVAIIVVLGASYARLLWPGTGRGILYACSLLSMAAILISPIVWAYHHVLYFIPFAFVANDLAGRRWKIPRDFIIALLTVVFYALTAVLDGYYGRSYSHGLFVIAPSFYVQAGLWLLLLLYPEAGPQEDNGESGKKEETPAPLSSTPERI
jgi:hypothetical protein